MKPFVIILSGPPGSGKSTFHELWSDYIFHYAYQTDNNLYYILNMPALSSDDIIESYAYLVGKTYSEVFKDVIDEAMRQLNFEKSFYIKNKKSFFWDQTNIGNYDKRFEGLEDYIKIYIKFNLPEQILFDRVKKRKGKVIPDHVLLSMIKRNEEDMNNIPEVDFLYVIEKEYTEYEYKTLIELIIDFIKKELNGTK